MKIYDDENAVIHPSVMSVTEDDADPDELHSPDTSASLMNYVSQHSDPKSSVCIG